MFNRQRLFAVVHKEFIHVFRDWRSLFLAIAIPMTLIMLFGYALNMDLNQVPTGVWDRSMTPESREFLSLLDGSAYFSLTGFSQDTGNFRPTLRRERTSFGRRDSG